MCMRSGNPHFMIDPIIAKAMAQHIAQASPRSIRRTPQFYHANYKKFEATINAKLQEWGDKAVAVQRPAASSPITIRGFISRIASA